MFFIFIFVIFLIASGVFLFIARSYGPQPRAAEVGEKKVFKNLSIFSLLISIVSVVIGSITTVSASHVAVLKEFGSVKEQTLTEGAHFIPPWYSTTEVYLGQQVEEVKNSEASSMDLQSVHSDLVVNYTVIDPLSLYKINTTLSYPTLIVAPAVQEVFKSVVSNYTAEQLVTHRAEVSVAITKALGEKLHPYFLRVQTINLTNFGFSKAFNDSIEEKVTASQKAETAKRNLERIKFEAQARVEEATGEAKAIQIQAAAIQSQGGQAYTQLKAIEKWDGKMPQYITSGAATPFISVK